jgi:hypothetical protein
MLFPAAKEKSLKIINPLLSKISKPLKMSNFWWSVNATENKPYFRRLFFDSQMLPKISYCCGKYTILVEPDCQKFLGFL